MAFILGRFCRKLWNGPFYVGQLQQPISVGSALLKVLEVLWRALVSVVALAAALALSIYIWIEVLSPAIWPPASSKLTALVSFDDGTAAAPPVLGGIRSLQPNRSRCTPEHPFLISFSNKSTNPITDIYFDIQGRRRGFSDDVIDDYSRGPITRIIEGRQTATACFSAPVPEGVDASALQLSIKVSSARYFQGG